MSPSAVPLTSSSKPFNGFRFIRVQFIKKVLRRIYFLMIFWFTWKFLPKNSRVQFMQRWGFMYSEAPGLILYRLPVVFSAAISLFSSFSVKLWNSTSILITTMNCLTPGCRAILEKAMVSQLDTGNPRFLRKQKICFCVHKNPSTVSILSHMNPIDTLINSFVKIQLMLSSEHA
jgi:hypothetical protein